MKRITLTVITLLTFQFAQAQWTDLDASIGGVYNYVLGDQDWTGGGILTADINAKYRWDNGLFLSFGAGFMDSEVTGLRDYSPQFPCDNRDGVVDSLNSYYEYGNDRSHIVIPLKLGYHSGIVEWSFGVDWLINIRTDYRNYLVECGQDRVESSSGGENPTWDENASNVGLTLEANIGLLKNRRLRIIPRLRYVVSPTDVPANGSFNELQYLLSVGYRIWRVE
jgi:hypothetical protein